MSSRFYVCDTDTQGEIDKYFVNDCTNIGFMLMRRNLLKIYYTSEDLYKPYRITRDERRSYHLEPNSWFLIPSINITRKLCVRLFLDVSR